MARQNQTAEANSMWKGDAASYSAFHKRVRRRRGTPSKCVQCGETSPNLTYEWANLTGRYEDPNDYIRLCASCHRRMDKSTPEREARDRRIVDLRIRGWSYEAIASDVGLGPSRVSQIYRARWSTATRQASREGWLPVLLRNPCLVEYVR